MARLDVALCFAGFSFLFGCSAPFAPTRYPIIADAGFEGSWRFVVPQDIVGERTFSHDPVVIQVRAMPPTPTCAPRPEGAAERPGGPGGVVFTDVESWSVNPGPGMRYSVVADRNGAKEAPDPWGMVLEGQLIQTQSCTLLTLQPTGVFSFAISSFAVPVQQTLRLERRGDKLTVWRSRVNLVWVPVPMAGELAFQPPALHASGDGSWVLAQTADQVFEFMEKAPVENWVLMGTGERVR